MVKNLPGMQKTWVQSLGQEEPLEKGMATHSSIAYLRGKGKELPQWSCGQDFASQCRECGFDSWLGSYDPTCLLAKKQKQYCNRFNTLLKNNPPKNKQTNKEVKKGPVVE